MTSLLEAISPTARELLRDEASCMAELRRIEREAGSRFVRRWINRAIWAAAGALLALAGYLFSK